MSNRLPFELIVIDCAGTPFASEKNDYSCFSKMVGRFGVYVFQHNRTREVLYVGVAHKQDLKTRVQQNYTSGDTGGTFRINYCSTEQKTFSDFKEILSQCSLQVVSICLESRVLLCALEAILISVLQPKFNR